MSGHGTPVARLTRREEPNQDGSARCGRCIGRGYIPEERRTSPGNHGGFYARNCPRCGGGGLVRIEREAAVKFEAKYDGLRKDEPHVKGEKPWEYNAWTVTLSRPSGRPITTTYKMGTGLKTKPFTRGGLTRPLTPTVRDVLQSLQSDASDIHAGCTFEEWADSLGYDSDSRRALAVYLACQEIHTQLVRLFGRPDFEAFMDFDFDEMRPRSEEIAAEVAK